MFQELWSRVGAKYQTNILNLAKKRDIPMLKQLHFVVNGEIGEQRLGWRGLAEESAVAASLSRPGPTPVSSWSLGIV